MTLVDHLSSNSIDVVRILHISDLHFGPPLVHYVADALLESTHELDPDCIVVSGDLTQRAKEEQFRDARAFLDKLPDKPRLIIPGNHDVPLYQIHRRVASPHRLYQEYICEDLNPVMRVRDALFVGLDSTAPRRTISNGRIQQWQLDHCEDKFLGEDDSVAKIVVAHHHFAPAPDYLRDWTMPGSKRAMMRFIDLDVDLILGGHLHRAYIGNSLDFYPGSHRERGIIIAQAGTATSRRGRGREAEKNSFNLIEIDRHSIQISHYMYFEASSGFVPTSQHVFRRF